MQQNIEEMKYIEVRCICKPHSEMASDVLVGFLSDIGFESFVETNDGLLAYISENDFSQSNLDNVLQNFIPDVEIDFEINQMPDKNWNEEWEKHYFKPIVIDDKCIIHSSFHEIEKEYEYNIVIDPKMAFGTGHHQTTVLMMRNILDLDLQDKTVLDMGCGTAVLAILSEMRGAKRITAIDIDEWAYNNARENLSLNNMSRITALQGDAKLLGKETYDVILANINRNILLQDIPTYAKVLNNKGILMMSGFYEKDLPVITEKCNKNGLEHLHYIEKDGWVSVIFGIS